MTDRPEDERLQDYLDGRLSPEERAAFDERLRDEPELARAVRAAQRVGEALRDKDAALSSGFYSRARRRFEEETAPSHGPFRLRSWEGAGLAAAAVLAFALFVPYFLREGTPEPGVPRPSVAMPPSDTAKLESREEAPVEKKRAVVQSTEPETVDEIVAAPPPTGQRVESDRAPAGRTFADSPRSAAAAEPQEFAPTPTRKSAADRDDDAVSAARGKVLRQSVSGSATPSVTVVALPVGAVEPGSFRTVPTMNEWANLLVEHRESLDLLGAVDERKRLVLVGARDDLDDCAALTLISVRDGWELRYHPVDSDTEAAAATGGCALTVPQDGKPVRLVTAP